MPMTPHIQSLLDYINAHNHHALRHDADWHLEDDFSARKLSPTKRSAEALKAMLAAETPAFILDERIAFTRTVKQIPEQFTEDACSPSAALWDWPSVSSSCSSPSSPVL